MTEPWTFSDAELATYLLNLADQHEAIENREDRWKEPPYLPQNHRRALRETAKRLLDRASHTDAVLLRIKRHFEARSELYASDTDLAAGMYAIANGNDIQNGRPDNG